ncbi:MAG: DUF4956 domain-containing protein [Candidatus Krumholzibacteriota bacterium]|nr:DUF4956 domain-containing protein [Candidatus Krumholzibacteriota bacterium]
MLNDLVASGERFELVDIMANVLIAFVIGTAIALIYRRTHRGFNYSCSFVNTLVLLPMITTVVMMVIGNSLARAFGLVGAMSIIRFRTVVKDTRDTAFVFLALAAGLAAGAGYHLIALLGSGLVLLMILLLHAGNFGSVRNHEQLLRFSVSPDERGAMLHEPAFNEFLRHSSLVNIQTHHDGRLLELSYYVRLRAPERARDFVAVLGAIDGISGVTLISMEDVAEP